MPYNKNDPVLMNTVARKLKEAREKRGMSLDMLSFAADTNIKYLRGYEAGRTFPSINKLRTFAKIFGVSIDWFFNDEDETPSAVANEQIEELRKKLEAVLKLVLENCASENATQELLVDRGLVTRKELDEREKKYKLDLDIAFVQKAVEGVEQ